MSSDIPVAPAATVLLPPASSGPDWHYCDSFRARRRGVLRTYDRAAEAVRVIHRALEHGVNYCDTAPPTPAVWIIMGRLWGTAGRDLFSVQDA